MVHAWSTNHALGEKTDDVKIETKIGIFINGAVTYVPGN